MIVFAEKSLDRPRRPANRHSARLPAILAIILLLASAMLAPPAEARRRQRFYAPPQAAMVVDGVSGKILYQSNPDAPRYPASITKVMTLYLLFEELKTGHLKMSSELKVTSYAAGQA